MFDPRLLVLWTISSLAAPGAPSAAEIEKFGLGAVSIGQMDPEMLPSLVPQLLIESGGLGTHCQKALEPLRTFDSVQRQKALPRALEACEAPCPGAPAGTAALSRLDRGAATVQACDKLGPDPVFGGALAPLRTEMEPLEYALMRHLLGQQRARLLANGSKRAQLAWERLERLLPRVALALVNQQRRLLADSAIPPAGEEVIPPRPHPLRAGSPPIVSVAPSGGLYLDGQPIEKAQLGPRVATAGEAFRRRFGEPPGVILQVAGAVPFGVVEELLPRLAPLGAVQFALPIHDRRYSDGARWSHNPLAPMVLKVGSEPQDWTRLLEEEIDEEKERNKGVEIEVSYSTEPIAVTALPRPNQTLIRQGPKGPAMPVKDEAQLRSLLKSAPISELQVVAETQTPWEHVLRTMYLFPAGGSDLLRVRLTAGKGLPAPTSTQAPAEADTTPAPRIRKHK